MEKIFEFFMKRTWKPTVFSIYIVVFAHFFIISDLRITTGPLKLNNYDIPENTGILASTMPVHLDPDYWNDPKVWDENEI